MRFMNWVGAIFFGFVVVSVIVSLSYGLYGHSLDGSDAVAVFVGIVAFWLCRRDVKEIVADQKRRQGTEQ